jgi:hypothetical protein
MWQPHARRMLSICTELVVMLAGGGRFTFDLWEGTGEEPRQVVERWQSLSLLVLFWIRRLEYPRGRWHDRSKRRPRGAVRRRTSRKGASRSQCRHGAPKPAGTHALRGEVGGSAEGAFRERHCSRVVPGSEFGLRAGTRCPRDDEESHVSPVGGKRRAETRVDQLVSRTLPPPRDSPAAARPHHWASRPRPGNRARHLARWRCTRSHG